MCESFFFCVSVFLFGLIQNQNRLAIELSFNDSLLYGRIYSYNNNLEEKRGGFYLFFRILLCKAMTSSLFWIGMKQFIHGSSNETITLIDK